MSAAVHANRRLATIHTNTIEHIIHCTVLD